MNPHMIESPLIRKGVSGVGFWISSWGVENGFFWAGGLFRRVETDETASRDRDWQVALQHIGKARGISWSVRFRDECRFWAHCGLLSEAA
jgi:hypothetical protein